MASPGFWEDQETAQKVIQEAKGLKHTVDQWQNVLEIAEEADVMLELISEEADSELRSELQETISRLKKAVETIELAAMLSGDYDQNNAIVSIHPGAGGTESQDWAQMLLRMYTRWAEDRGFRVETLDLLPGDEAGIKSVTLLVSGLNCFGYLRSEKGVHRLVRISPFDASGRRHTSFASVEVVPEVDEEVEIAIDPTDLRVDTFRSSGAGGQHVNTTDSAIRITHIPSGIVVQCQNERSQHANKDTAMKVLRARLAEKELMEKQAKLKQLKGEQSEIAWGSQIRSYVFCPYTMVKDHRSDLEIGNVSAVMDGDIDSLIEAYLKMKQ